MIAGADEDTMNLRKQSQDGFTLLELLLAVTIIGIISATAPFMISDYVREKQAEMHVADFWMEMNSVRGKVLKFSAPAVTLFDLDNSGYAVYIDSNYNSIPDLNEFLASSGKAEIVFGTPTPTPGSFPFGVDNLDIVSDSWQNGFWISDNSTLTAAAGHIYLKNRTKEHIGYCLVVAPGESELQLFKWNGSKWYEY